MAKKDGNFDLILGYQDTKSLVKRMIIAQEPILIHGKPGIGKSDMIREIAKELDRQFIDIRLPLYESVDLKGYPYLKDLEDGEKVLSFALSEELPFEQYHPDSNAIILFDEINGAMPSTQLATYQLFLDRAIGNKKLAKDVAMIAAGNRECDKGATYSMAKPLENRFAHVELETEYKDWATWAIKNNVPVSIIGYLAKNEARLNAFDPQSSSRAFATPRTWGKAAKLLNLYADASEDTIYNLMASIIGVSTTMEFMAFRKIAHEIPDAMSILKGEAPKLTKERASLDIAYMLVTNVLYKLRSLYEENKRKTGAVAYELTDELAEYTNNFFEYLLANEKSLGEEFLALPVNMITKTYNLPLKQNKMPAIPKLMIRLKGTLDLVFK